MAQQRVTIAIDVVSDGRGGAKVKSVLSDVEREAKASQKRVEANSKATDKAILASAKANARAEEREAKRKADEFIRQIKRVEREAKESTASIKKSGGMVGSVFAGSFAGNVASQGLSILTSQLQRAGAAVFEFSSKMQQSQVAFGTLMGNSRQAAQHIKELQDLTVKFPLDFTAISTLSQRLQGAGIEAKKIVPLIKDIGNVAAATGDLSADRLEGIGIALAQIASKGKVSAEEMEQLSERGVPAWKLLSEAIGKTSGETRKLAEDGEITADVLFKAFTKMSRVKFGDAMKNQANTFSGAMKQIENVLMITASEAFKPFMAKISGLATESAKEIQKQKGSWNGIGFTMGKALGQGITAGVAEIISKLPALVGGVLAGLGRGVMQIGLDYSSWAMRNALTVYGALDDTRWGKAVNRSVDRANLKFGVTGAVDPSKTSSVTTLNYSRPGDRSSATSPSVMNAGGGMMMPKVKSSKVNLNLKNEMADALNIAARYGLTVTSGKDGKHNAGSSHLTGGAFDIRTNGVSPAVIEAARRALTEAGYYVKDERFQPAGQKVWSAPHLHVGGRTAGGKAAVFDPVAVQSEITARLKDESDAKTKQYQDDIVDSFIRVYDKTGLLPTGEMFDRVRERLGEFAAASGGRRPEVADVERELARIRVERLSRRVQSVSDESGLGIGTILNTQPLEDIPSNPLEEKARKANEDFWNDWRDEQQRAFDDAADSWEDLLTNLANGDFSSIWRNLKSSMIQQFVQPMSQALAGMFGGVGGQGGSMLGGLFGGGGMGPGGTPMFNPANSFVPGGSGGGIGSMFSGLFGGGSSGIGSSSMEPGIGSSIGLPGGGMFSTGGKGLGGMMRGMGGGSMLAGAAGMGGMAATMIGGALGGKWGNFLSMAGMGVSIGANFGPWGALIGGAIGAGAGLISMLFGRDNAEKKIKEAALSQYGITIKDKSVLKSLKALGETMFGKGKVGGNAASVISSDQGQLILRNYAEASGQSSKKIDQLYYGDETWSGNQFNSKFGGFRAMGGPVSAGTSYIVGERGQELFTPSTSGTITSNADMGGIVKVIAQLEETVHAWKEKLVAFRPGDVVGMGLDQNPEAAVNATNKVSDMSFGYGERSLKAQGVW